jgi:SPP1 gp7 family putative phage head morphogenesis protein
MNDIYDEEALDQLEQEEFSEVEKFLLILFGIMLLLRTELEDAIRIFYQKYGINGVVTYHQARKWISNTNHHRRLNVLLATIRDKFNISNERLKVEFEAALNQVISKELGFFDVDLDDDSINAIKTAEWGTDELNWSDRLDKNILLWSAYVATDLKHSMIRQDHLEDVLDQLEDRFESIEKSLRKLIVSEASTTNSMTRHRIFEELGILKYQFFTRVDERRCEVCGSMHGRIFSMSEYEIGVTASPLHSHCRCWEVPIRE